MRSNRQTNSENPANQDYKDGGWHRLGILVAPFGYSVRIAKIDASGQLLTIGNPATITVVDRVADDFGVVALRRGVTKDVEA